MRMLQLSERRRKEIASLSRNKKYRIKFGQTIIEGVRSLESAVNAEAPLTEIFVTERALLEIPVQRVLEQVQVPVFIVTEEELARFSDVETNQGLLAVTRTTFIDRSAVEQERTLLVLDGIQDPGNVGTIMRAAAWFGTGAVIARPGTVDFFNPKTVRASMGSLWDLNLFLTDDLVSLMKDLRTKDFTIYGAEMEGTDIRLWEPRSPSILVLGSEAHGINPDLKTTLDQRVTIPGHPRRRGTESLNVAVAAGILIYRWLNS